MSPVPRPRGLVLPVRPVRLLGALTALAFTTLALLSARTSAAPVPGLIAAAVFVTVATLLLRVREDRMPLPWTIVGALTPVTLVAIAAPSAGSNPFDAWYLGAGIVVLMLLALRGRIVAAWLAAAAQSAAVLVVRPLAEAPIADTIALLIRQLALLVIVTLFAVGIRAGVRRLDRIRRAEVRDARLTAAIGAAEAERAERLGWAYLVATRLLRRIASGEPLTPALRLEAALAEAELRDGLRAYALARHPVPAAAREARARGVEVVLLDDRADPLPEETLAPLRLDVAERLEAVQRGRIVVRLLPAGRGELLTIVEDPDHEVDAAAFLGP